MIKSSYSFFKVYRKTFPLAIYSLDGRSFTNGLADRLRGMISIYAYAKYNNIGFRIDHQVPFSLDEYFQPNEYDWVLKPNEKSNNIFQANPIFLMDYTKGVRLLYLRKNRQHHFYTNINCLSLINQKYNTQFLFSTLFHELFRPSLKLQNAIDKCILQIGSHYISVSFRFMQLLGDFKDIRGNILGKCEQETLIADCKNCVYKIKERHPEISKILVTADSQKFIDAIKSVPFVYVIPGKIAHIGHVDDANTNLKTFLDFYMISCAQKAYLGCTGEMYKSNFAKTAALSNNIPYEEIMF